MAVSSVEQFADTVMRDFQHRRAVEERSIVASATRSVETKALGHPDFEELPVGQRRTASLAAVFLDLTDFKESGKPRRRDITIS